jgi:hypothetical protein
MTGYAVLSRRFQKFVRGEGIGAEVSDSQELLDKNIKASRTGGVLAGTELASIKNLKAFSNADLNRDFMPDRSEEKNPRAPRTQAEKSLKLPKRRSQRARRT